MDRSMTLCRRPYIYWEPGTVRWPGVFQIAWDFRRFFGFAVELVNTQDDEYRRPWMLYLHLIFVRVFLRLPGPLRPILDREGRRCYGEWAVWGFRCGLDSDIVFSWGFNRTKHFRWPWDWQFNRHDVRLPGGDWARVEGGWELGEAIKAQAERWALPYRYTLQSGEIQDRTATIFVERRFWRRLWLARLPIFERCSTVINVTFSDEVGERSGSWKGGCIGCTHEMRPGETAEETLRRMEAERKF